ncbi:MAG: ABC transporter substrate-binding protein [Spirochaetaceae bacterium]|jgi:raffinose/stachyose/melibiose transport system substrate-binding protein|nr:ABC transporter substrate-binding protein [Spirochaetaceae bacterium]
MKKIAIVLLLMMVFGSMVYAGGGKQSASGSGGGKTLTIAASANWVKEIEHTLADKFTAETGIKVEFQIVPDDQYFNVIQSRLSMGEGPDIFQTHGGTTFENLQPDKNFADLSGESWVPRLEDWARQGGTINGKVIALNLWAVDGWAVLYDPAKFQKAGVAEVPKTYAELTAACDKLLQAGYIPFYADGAAVWYQSLWLSITLGTAGQQYSDYEARLNNNTLKFVDVPAYVTVLTQVKEMYDKGYFGPTFMTDTWENSTAEMASGKYAMTIAYTTYQNEVFAVDPACGADTWEMFPIPLADNRAFNVNPGIFHVVNRNSPNIDAAKAYLNFRTRLDNVGAYYKGNDVLGNSSIKDYTEIKATKAYESVSKNSVGTSFATNTIKFFSDVVIGQAVQEMFLGQKTAKQVLEALDEERQKQFALGN